MTRAALVVAAAALAAPSLAGADGLKVETKGPGDLTATSATFQADVKLSALGTVTWDYGTSTDYGMSAPPVQTTLQGDGQKVAVPVTGLLPNTTYHVRASATSLLTVLQGKDVQFKTKKADATPSGATPAAPASSAAPATTTTPASPATPSTPATPATSDSASGKGQGRGRGKGRDDAPGLDPAQLDDDGTDGGATAAPGVATAAVAPVLGRSVAVAAVAGSVTATAPSGTTVDLATARTIPTGTIIDARNGTVELTTALARAGATQTARFWGARFTVHQGTRRGGLTRIVLRGADFGACPTGAAARASRVSGRKPPARSLWGSDDHGKFQTRGRGSVATVRGTRWVTTDTCAGTRTTVLKGAVAVRDLRRDRTVVVTAGQSYLARVAP